MRVILTGGAGFIGSALVSHLVVNRGWQVLNIDRLTYASIIRSLEPVAGRENYHFLHADICDAAAMAKAFAEFQPNAVMHLAADRAVDVQRQEPYLSHKGRVRTGIASGPNTP